ncbi:helix-turn-helix domain-containing protein [Aquabacterium humicola]|uniref:helix-turn-helix domain-containing protein n=1 Tax=Aquabacterium humicola TaxID=3237377 RepID=UPI002543AF04|nr:helix-turn-helix transcriptional regulator [Rubrivivax pictus]
MRAAAVLAGSTDATELATLLGWPVHEVLAAGPVDVPADTAPLAEWFRAAPEVASRTFARALAWLSAQGRVEQAAPLVLAFGTPAQRLALLEQAGWLLLWRPRRAVLGPLLASVSMEPGADAVLPLQLAWWIEVERVSHVAERRLQQLAERRRQQTAADDPALPLPLRAALHSRLAQVFDDARGALRWARQAEAGYPTDLTPDALFARYALGLALLDAGQPRAALAPLATLLHACARDGLPMLALDAFAAQARAHDELGDDAALRTTLDAARALAQAQGIADAPALQLLERLRRGQALRRAAFAEPPTAPGTDSDTPLAPPLPATDYDAFPNLVLDALALLQADALAEAADALAALARRETQAFHCRKWRNAHRHARLWWLARRPQAAALADAMAEVPAVDEASTLVELHQAVLAAAAAALAGRPIDAAMLAAWQAELGARGLVRLSQRLALVQAIGTPPDTDALLGWLGAQAADPAPWDAAWLAPKLAKGLEALLTTPAIVRYPAERALAQRLLQHMLAPPAVDTPAEAVDIAAPADLTHREWEILQLIGRHYTNEQIAHQLNVSLATVKTHINRVYGKLGIGSRAEAVQRAHALQRPAG